MSELIATLEGEIVDGVVNAVAAPQTAKEYLEKGFGYQDEEGKLILSPVEALYLMEKGKLKVYMEDKTLKPTDLLSLIEKEEKIFLDYLVYKDLRERGRIVKPGPNEMLRLFPRQFIYGETPSRYLVLPVSEEKPMTLKEFTETVSESMKMRKELLMAIVNDEGITSYYVTREIEILSIGTLDLNFPKVKAYLYGDRLVVWEPREAIEMYKTGFFGHPIGIRKPKTFDFNVPSQLSLYEGYFLLKKEKLTVIDPEKKKELNEEEFEEVARGLRERFDTRCRVYNFWRDKGYVVKSGSIYGVDFIIYKAGPGMEHAPYMVHSYDEESLFIPLELIRAGRVATTIKKKFFIALVENTGRLRTYKFSWYKP